MSKTKEQKEKKEKREKKQVLPGVKTGAKAGTKKADPAAEDRAAVLSGVFQSNLRGFGFVVVEGMEEDLFVPAGRTGNAFWGDTVEVRLRTSGRPGRKTEAEVVRILAHSVERVVGSFKKEGGHGLVTPDNHRIPYDFTVSGRKSLRAVPGDKVVLEITDYGSPARNPQGVITEILGHRDDPGVDILSIIRENDLPQAFTPEVCAEAGELPQELRLPAPHRAQSGGKSRVNGREDLRTLTMVTIDGEDTKDIDDAVSLSRLDNGNLELGVHIADVSEYVREGSALDREALHRGTSVYLVDRVIPMLPRELSNGICSLNEGEDRYALSCLMELDPEGKLLRSRLAETVVRIDARCSYTGVQAFFERRDTAEIEARLEGLRGGAPFRGEKAIVLRITRMLRDMRKLSRTLTGLKGVRGTIDFDFPEAQIVLDADGHPTDILRHERNEATMLIENFMLLANETVAKTCSEAGLPFVYRSHGTPGAEKIRELFEFVSGLAGLPPAGSAERRQYAASRSTGRVTPGEIQALLSRIQGTPQEATLNRMVLRSMQQAKYTTECEGHFGLSLQFYCHFTSPIRRYPDLQIHRIIKEFLHEELTPARIAHYRDILGSVAQHASETERRADDAERQTDKLKKCEYMARFVGEEFEGTISGVTGRGLFVELANTCEGMVPVSCLFDDYYVFDEKSYILRGERTGRTYGLGQKMKIRVAAADLVSRTVDFVPADGAATRRTKRQSQGHGHGRRKKQHKADRQ